MLSLSFKTIVVLTAAFGAASAKRERIAKRCSVGPEPTTTISEPAPTSTATPPPPAPTTSTPPSGGGGEHPVTGEYAQSDNYVGQNWYDGWDFWSYGDPTNGRVNFVDADTAKRQNLTSVQDDSFIMRADSWTVLDPNGPGRNAVRIQSKKAYTIHTAVLDIKHMPQGPGTWPAYWMCGADWPNQGEFDIIEGVNDGTNNLSSLHTSSGCTQPDSRDQKGTSSFDDCSAYGALGNQGCGVINDSPASFGPNFNNVGGGWYATERTQDTIKVWFWGRNDPSVPSEVRNNNGAVSPSNWGRPSAVFVNNSCDLNAKFGPNNFIINLTFCGDWAGNVFNGGIGACNDFVNYNPGAFANAYFDITRLTVYE